MKDYARFSLERVFLLFALRVEGMPQQTQM